MKRYLGVILMLAILGAAPRYVDHQNLMYWIDEKGERQEVKTFEDWGWRRAAVLPAFPSIMVAT